MGSRRFFSSWVLPSAAERITLDGMTTISLKLPEVLLRDLEAEARHRGVSKSALIRETLEARLRRTRAQTPVTCLDLLGDLVGSQPGPADASTNPRHLKEAVLDDALHERKNNR
jgi:hypothetical protein